MGRVGKVDEVNGRAFEMRQRALVESGVRFGEPPHLAATPAGELAELRQLEARIDGTVHESPETAAPEMSWEDELLVTYPGLGVPVDFPEDQELAGEQHALERRWLQAQQHETAAAPGARLHVRPLAAVRAAVRARAPRSRRTATRVARGSPSSGDPSPPDPPLGGSLLSALRRVLAGGRRR